MKFLELGPLETGLTFVWFKYKSNIFTLKFNLEPYYSDLTIIEKNREIHKYPVESIENLIDGLDFLIAFKKKTNEYESEQNLKKKHHKSKENILPSHWKYKDYFLSLLPEAWRKDYE